MAKASSPKRLILFLVGAAVAVGFVGEFMHLRKEAGGLRNLLSRKYWSERSAGTDLYNAEKSMFVRGSRDYKEVVLTIDDGPHRGSMDSILDTLKKENIHATFFVVGTRVKAVPDLVRRMIAEGNEVGNHTQDHIRLDTLTEKQVRNEIVNCQTNVIRATGHTMTLLRPPGMHFNPMILKIIKQLGYTTVYWSLGAKDFLPSSKKEMAQFSPEVLKKLHASPEEITERVLKQVQNGSIILLHDNPVTAKALPMIIERLEGEGYTFRTTEQMLARIPNAPHNLANPPASVVAAKP